MNAARRRWQRTMWRVVAGGTHIGAQRNDFTIGMAADNTDAKNERPKISYLGCCNGNARLRGSPLLFPHALVGRLYRLGLGQLCPLCLRIAVEMHSSDLSE